MTFPAPTNENTPGGHWLRKLLRACIASRVLPGNGYFVKVTPTGTILEIRTGGGGSSKAQPHRFKSMGTDHIICRTWDGITEGTTDVKIAKPPHLWFSVAAETLRTTPVTYSAYSLQNQSRQASRPSGSEIQLITRAYEVNDIIWAVQCETFMSVGQPAVKVALQDNNVAGRAWAAQ